MPRRNLHDCRFLLTGASSGIGREVALALARRGARLLLSSRREDLLRKLVDECAKLGGAAEFVPGDVTDPAVRAALIARAVNLWGGLDALVNNAGVSAHGSFADSDEATLRQVMEVNFFAAAELTRLAIPILLNPVTPRSPEGSAQSSTPNPQSAIPNPQSHSTRPAILNVGSIIGHRGLPLNSEYAASKFALRGWTEALRRLAPRGVDVLLASPGTTDTEFVDHLIARRAVLPWSNSKSITAAAAAEQIIRALERNRREVFPNWRGRALVTANRLFPGLVDRVVSRLAKNP